ncbi:arylsulfatase [Flagellimonas sp.]|uniref:arylsulfatase n=1 Tax=Flagellimonas sp. TaxID=2058762 RepID=UPI003BAE2013
MIKKNLLLLLSISTLILACNSIGDKGLVKNPNVVLIIADDLGYGDLSCYGQTKLQTSNIDRLATDGIRFTDHYAGNTVCSPSRAVLMTGQSPMTVHLTGNIPYQEDKTALDTGILILPGLFKKAGYATGAFGKWGLGITSNQGAENPMTHGFDHFTGWKSQRIAHTYYPKSIVKDGKEIPLESGTYVHDLIMEDAFEFISTSAENEQPFFCYIPTAIPHAAMHAPQDLHEKWMERFPEFNDKVGKYDAGPGEVCPSVQNPIAGFGAMMEHLDNQVGELLNMLDSLGIDENTLIMFSSDNGPHHEGGHDPIFWNSNGSLKGGKRDLYEGGIRVPFLARWPKKIKPGSLSNHPSAFWDIMPTISDIIGIETPPQSDGISFLPTLLGKGKQQKHDYLYWEYRERVEQFLRIKAIRKRDWKAVVKFPKSEGEQSEPRDMELYNLKDDLGEENNVAGAHPDIVNEFYSFLNSDQISSKKSNN